MHLGFRSMFDPVSLGAFPLKLFLPPLISAAFFASELFGGAGDTINVLLNIAALAVLFAGFLVVARYRAALDATRIAGEAWKDERDAERSKAERLEQELRARVESEAALTARLAIAEAKPDLSLILDSNQRLTETVVTELRAISDILQKTQDLRPKGD